MRYFRYFIVITALSFSCQKKPITEIQEVETPELVSIDSIQSILTWVFNDGKTLWDGTLPVHGHRAIKWRYADRVESQTFSSGTSSPNKAFHAGRKMTC